MKDDENVILGIRDAWGQENPVSLSCADRRRHLYVVGMTGVGKTTFLRQMIEQDIAAGRGVAFVDPHGDDAHDLLDYIPSHRIEDVIYFDPSDSEYAISFNLFARVPPDRRHLVASGIVGAFKGLFADSFGPRMEYYFYAAVMALLECENVSFLSLQRMLTDAKYRRWVVRQVKDPMVKATWEREFEPRDKASKEEIVSPILNKVGQLLMTPQLRNILGQVRSRIDFRHIIDSGKIFIANLSKGRIGEDKTNLLGSFLVSQFHLAAMSRADAPEDKRPDFFLYIDEFQSFVSDSFASALSEVRKNGLCLTLSHQYLSQLSPRVAAAVAGNVGNLIAFRVGHEDAEALEKAFGKTYAASAFTSLSNGEVYAKCLSRGRHQEPFLARTHPPQGPYCGRRDTIIRRSRERFSVRREIIERKIDNAFKSTRRNNP